MSFQQGADELATTPSLGRAVVGELPQPPSMEHFRSEASTSVRKALVRDLLCHVGGFEAFQILLAALGQAYRAVELLSIEKDN